ncbi:MAG: HPr family phosphocarrier protein [Candidatus Ornithomonoglobus sp.]
MKEFRYVITDPDGIHARPAGELVHTAKSYESDVNITKDDKTVSAKKIFAVMSLAVKQGQEVVFTFKGTDEDKAAAGIEKFMKENL